MRKEKEHLNCYIGKTTEKLAFEICGQLWNRATKVERKVCGGLRCMKKKQKMAISLVSVQIM